VFFFFFFSSRRRHTRWPRDWSSDVCSSDLDGKRFPAEWDVVRNRIVSSVGQEHFVNHRDKAIDYVREYMRRLVPHASVVGEQNRSEERRVGKECRARWWREQEKRNSSIVVR